MKRLIMALIVCLSSAQANLVNVSQLTSEQMNRDRAGGAYRLDGGVFGSIGDAAALFFTLMGDSECSCKIMG